MRLAGVPTIVTLPASVAVMAMTSQARCGAAGTGTNDLSTRTEGTLLTSFYSTAVTAASTALSARRSSPIAAITSGVITVFSNPATTTNRPTNITSSGQ